MAFPHFFANASSVGCDQQIFQVPQRGIGRQRFFFEDVEGSAAEFVIAQGLGEGGFVAGCCQAGKFLVGAEVGGVLGDDGLPAGDAVG